MLNSKKRKLDKLKNSKFSSLEAKTRFKKKINEQGDEEITREKSEEETESDEEMKDEAEEKQAKFQGMSKDGFAVPKKKAKKLLEEEEEHSEGSDLEFEDEFDDEYGKLCLNNG